MKVLIFFHKKRKQMLPFLFLFLSFLLLFIYCFQKFLGLFMVNFPLFKQI